MQLVFIRRQQWKSLQCPPNSLNSPTTKRKKSRSTEIIATQFLIAFNRSIWICSPRGKQVHKIKWIQNVRWLGEQTICSPPIFHSTPWRWTDKIACPENANRLSISDIGLVIWKKCAFVFGLSFTPWGEHRKTLSIVNCKWQKRCVLLGSRVRLNCYSMWILRFIVKLLIVIAIDRDTVKSAWKSWFS